MYRCSACDVPAQYNCACATQVEMPDPAYVSDPRGDVIERAGFGPKTPLRWPINVAPAEDVAVYADV
jgi:hypothetical protein